MLKELYARLYSGRFAKNDQNLNYFRLIASRLHKQVQVSSKLARLSDAEQTKFPPELIRKYQQLHDQLAQQRALERPQDSAQADEQHPTETEA